MGKASSLFLTVMFLVGQGALADQQATAPANHTSIAAQPLEDALKLVGQQMGLEIVYVTKVVEGRLSNGAPAGLPVKKTLEYVLSGTGLTYKFLTEHTVSILPQTQDQATALGPVKPIADASTIESRITLAQNAASPGSAGSAQSDASASTGEDSKGTIQEIIVKASATRLDRGNVPTPMFTVGADRLNEGGRSNAVLALNDLPQFKPSSTPQTSAPSAFSGLSVADLRGLSGIGGVPTVRTLVLVDGRRPVSSDGFAIPNSLIGRVDVVTGSASAAWGSGAVAGMVNFITDDTLEGIRLGVRGGVSERADAEEKALDAAAGFGFAGGRGHFIVGGEYVDNDGGDATSSRSDVGRWTLVANTAAAIAAGQQPFIIAPDVGNANASPGGLILSGINAGRTFNPDGTLRTFDLGRLTGTLGVAGTSSIGGEAPSNDDVVLISAPFERYNILSRVSYQLTSALQASVELRHAGISANYDFFPSPSTSTIAIDNAFLPVAIRNQMTAAGQTSFTLGRFNTDYGTVVNDYDRQATQATLAVDGMFGETFKWGAYYSHGVYDETIDIANQRITANFNKAVDAVAGPSGAAVCRVNTDASTANDDPACVPINLFGEGAPSAQARAYVLGTATEDTQRKLDAAGVSVRGDPFSLWAGPVSVALGVEGRRDTLRTTADALSRANAFAFFPWADQSLAKNTTREAFAETLLPLVKDVPLLQLLQFNGAARITDDAIASIWSWKLGLIDRVSDGVQLRLTRSRDILAPTLTQLYGPSGLPSFPQITDFRTGTAYIVNSYGGGNPALQPEASDTTTAGITLTPSIVPSLKVSIDYYNIKIDNAIGITAPQTAVNQCAQGNAVACASITRGANGLITDIRASALNLNSLTTNGFDFGLEYRLPVPVPGQLRMRSNVTWVRDLHSESPVSGRTDLLGLQGFNTNTGVAKILANTALYYDVGNFGSMLRARYISAGDFSRTQAIENNHIPAFVYVDLGLKVHLAAAWASNAQLHANVNNLLDEGSPHGRGAFTYYDFIGRYYSLGATVRF